MAARLERILITGTGGFVGRHLVPALAAEFPQARLLTQHFDVTDADAAAGAIRDAAPDACVHLAAIAAPSRARAAHEEAWRVNLHGALAVGRAVMASAPGCVMLFAGSGDAYGASFRAGRPLDETAPLAPTNTYAATKAAADLALGALAAEGLRVIRLRPFNHIGPGQSADFAVSAFARQVALIAAGRQAPVLRVGALDAERDFLDVRDVCAAYVRCLQRGEALEPGTILNIASSVPRRISDVLTSLLRLAGVAAEVETDPALMRPADIPIACGNAGRARGILGWAPRIAWEQTLRDVLEDWRQRVETGN